MFDNDEEKAKLVHFGVLGMKWGRRKAEGSEGGGSSGGSVGSKARAAFRSGVNTLAGKRRGESDDDFEKRFDEESKAETAKLQRVDDMYKVSDAAKKFAKANPLDADAQVDAYRKEAEANRALNDAWGDKTPRPGKKKGESDADYDKRHDDAVEASIRVTVAKKAAKAADQTSRDETQAALVRQKAAKDRTAFLENYAAQSVGGIGRHKYDPKRAEKAADRIFGADMNKSAADIRADRISTGVGLAASFLLSAGIIAYNAYGIAKLQK